ncbi:MAG: SurA N-terminal domain-containing protein [Planctomycetota bacterium]
MMLLALGFLSFVLGGPRGDLDPDLVARVDGTPVTPGELQSFLATKYLQDPIYKRALEQLIDETVVTQQAKRRSITVTEREVEQRIAELSRRLLESGTPSLESYLESLHVSREDFTATLAKSIAQERMAREDFGLARGEELSEAKLRLWLKEQRSRSEIVTEGLPEAICARVNGQPLSKADLGGMIMKVLPETDLKGALTSLIGIVLIENHVKREGIELSAADLEREAANRTALLQGRYHLEQASLEKVYGMDVETLKRTRRFRAEAALGKIIDALYDEAALRDFYQQHKGEFDAAFGPEYDVAIIYLKAVAQPNAFIVRTFEQAEKELRGVKEQALEGRAFSDLAHIYSEHASASKGGRLGYITNRDPELRPVYEAAARSEPGAVTGPLRSASGVYLVQLIDSRPAPSFEGLVLEVRQRVRDEYYRSLGRTAVIERRY